MSSDTGSNADQKAGETSERQPTAISADRTSVFKDEADERGELLDVIGMLHKNMHNVKPPSGMYRDLTIEELRKVYQEYSTANEAHMREYHAEQYKAVADFEAEIAKAMTEHGIDRDTAIRWNVDARGLTEDVELYGLEYFENYLGLPYGYFVASPKSPTPQATQPDQDLP